MFVGMFGLNDQGIIAVDDITYMIEDCSLTPYDALPPGATTAARNTFSTLNPNSFTSSELSHILSDLVSYWIIITHGIRSYSLDYHYMWNTSHQLSYLKFYLI